jgi:hypothetical protein
MRGERGAPVFDSLKPRELSRYFSDLEVLFKRNKMTSDTEMKENTIYYVDFETEQIWKTFPEFADIAKTYTMFRDAILVHYPDATGENVYSLRDMDSLIGERQRLGINSTNDLFEYHIRFLAITTWLIQKKQLSDLEQKRAYLRAFQPPLLAAINNRLQMKFMDQHPNIPHEIKDVNDAVRFVLQTSSFSSQSYLAPAPPVTILQRPSPVPATPEPTVKKEDLGAFFADFTKTFMEAMSKNLRGPSGSFQPRQERQVDCNMCGGPHYIRDCKTVEEFTTAGKCKRNSEGKVVLPSGAYVPRDIPGTLLQERIDEWHRRNPNQLGVATLIHTIAREQYPTPKITEVHSSYQLSADDRIATLEAELFNLRARRPLVPPTIRTRAQKARNPSVEIEEEEQQTTPPSRDTTPEIVVPVVAPAAPPVIIISDPATKAPPISIQEHPFRNARDASYTPPVDRNVGAPVKAPAPKKADPAYKTLPPVHDASIANDVYKRSMDAQVIISQRELLSLSPEVRSQYREATTTRRIPNNAPAPQNFLVEEEDEVETLISPATTFTYRHVPHRTPPEGALVVPDPIETYYKSLSPGQTPDLDRLTVAKESTAIRSIFALVANSQKIECTVDPGCQIIAMAETECHNLGLAYDPRIRLNMESANGTFDWSLGLARNVPFQIGDIALYFQVHIISSPSYAVLLGRPFDVLTESVIRNFANEDQTITITDPNSGRVCTIPTFPRRSHKCDTNGQQDFH